MTARNGLALVLAAWLPMVGCGGEDCNCDIDDVDKEDDNEEDTSEDSGEDEVAHLNFCNPLVYNNEDVEMQVVIGDGDNSLELAASSRTCSSRLGDSCEEIAPGEEIPVAVLDENGTELFATTIDIEANREYVLSTNTDEEMNVVLDHGVLSDNFDCENEECRRMMHNNRTCAPEDPCDYAENKTCDEDLCLDHVDEMFDDSADCS